MSAAGETARAGREAPPPREELPRVGFLGLGWIGRSRMLALRDSGWAQITTLVDPDEEARRGASLEVPGASVLADPGEIPDLDGLVIATPSALHAEQAGRALAAGSAVFCEKPLGRDPGEVRDVLQAARAADRLLAVDLSYRHTAAARALREVVRAGGIGEVQFAELTFHNAYGPDKPWFTRRTLAGGGCLIDLGTHLLDLMLWITGTEDLQVQAAALRRHGRPLDPDGEDVEDLALAQLSTPQGAIVRLACSWFLPAGRDCVIECSLYGTEGAVCLRNVEGSFYDFVAERHVGTSRELLAAPLDDWGGGAITAWARRLASDRSFDPAAEELLPVADALQRIYEVAQ
jgi:predicted dehydrogenase